MSAPSRLPRTVVIIALLGAMLAGGNAAVVAQTGETVPVRRMALGVSMLPYEDLARLDALAARTGQMPAIWTVWMNWAGAVTGFPAGLMNQLRDRGVVPMVNWMPADYDNLWGSAYTHTKIARGDYDAFIRRWAQDAKAFGGKILLRFAHEFDGNWYPWGIGNFDNTPATFVAAWRHVWSVFDEVGATNVKWVWSPTYPSRKRPPWSTMYPGDQFVDYVAFTSYNWNRRGLGWISMVELYAPLVNALKKVSKRPIIVAETGSTDIGGDKAAWIRQGYQAVYKKWPRIKAIVYFNIDMRPKHRDWRLTSPTGAFDAYTEVLARPEFQGRF